MARWMLVVTFYFLSFSFFVGYMPETHLRNFVVYAEAHLCPVSSVSTRMKHDQNSRIALFPGAAMESSGSCFGSDGELLLATKKPKPFCGNVVPRETGFYHLSGHPEKMYRFGGETWTSTPASKACEEIAEVARKVLAKTDFVWPEGLELNSAVAQVYNGEKGAIGWHAGDEKSMQRLVNPEGELEVGPIVSVSFGASCKFSIRPIEAEPNAKRRKTKKQELHGGDVLVMKQGFQERYQHCIQKGDISQGTRICLTFRAQI